MSMRAAFDLGRYAAAVFDLDGTVWLSDTPMPGAADFVESCRQAGLTITFATNATAISVPQLTELLLGCGVARPGDGVVTGGSVVARALASLKVAEVIAEAPAAMVESMVAAGIAVQPADSTAVPDGWDRPRRDRAVVMGA